MSAEPAPVETDLGSLTESVSIGDAVQDVPLDAPLGTIPIRPLLFAAAQEWISFLPKPGNYQYRPGQSLDLSDATYDRVLENFNTNIYKQDLPIRVEHDALAAGAVGWIKPGGMRRAADGSLEVKPEWTPTGKGLIDQDRFRYTSAEIALNWQEPLSREWHKDVAVGLAICTRPHFKTDVLKPLAASEAAAITMMASAVEAAGETGKENPVMPDEKTTETPPVETPTPPPTAPTPEPAPAVTPEPAPEAPVAPAEPVSLMDVVMTADQRHRERQAYTTLTERVELAERRATAAEADNKAMRHDRLIEKFTAEVIGRSAENGIAWFGSVKANVNHLVSLAEAHGEDSSEVRYTVQTKRSEAKAIKATGIYDPISAGIGEDISNVTAQVAHLTEEIVSKNPSMTSYDAEIQVYKEHPELYSAYTRSKE